MFSLDLKFSMNMHCIDNNPRKALLSTCCLAEAMVPHLELPVVWLGLPRAPRLAPVPGDGPVPGAQPHIRPGPEPA